MSLAVAYSAIFFQRDGRLSNRSEPEASGRRRLMYGTGVQLPPFQSQDMKQWSSVLIAGFFASLAPFAVKDFDRKVRKERKETCYRDFV